ncbi:hypothetical protein F4604DRAFT_1937495 [Suillus subluteus]|nr:hypothetical protein F4604DRAFT_1937495 [Suillus subluteus]
MLDILLSIIQDIQVLDMFHGHGIAARPASSAPGDVKPGVLHDTDITELGRIMFHEVVRLDKSMHDNAGPLITDAYDCGWDDPMDAEHPGLGTSSTKREQLYDCGWDEYAKTPGAEDDLYDCGWGDSMDTMPLSPDISPGEENNAYNFASGDSTEAHGLAPMPTPIDQQDPHNCRWEDQTEDCLPPIIVTSSATQEDPYDCGWDEPTNIKAVPNGADEVNPYDCGWEDWRDDGSVVTADAGSVVTIDDSSVVTTDDSSTALEDHYDCGWGNLLTAPEDKAMEPVVIDLMSSTGSLSSSSICRSQSNAFEEAWQLMHDAVWQLKRVVPTTLMANQRLFGVYAEARSRVTEVGEDLVEVYHLLDIHRHIMEPLDAMITNIQEGRWE